MDNKYNMVKTIISWPLGDDCLNLEHDLQGHSKVMSAFLRWDPIFWTMKMEIAENSGSALGHLLHLTLQGHNYHRTKVSIYG